MERPNLPGADEYIQASFDFMNTTEDLPFETCFAEFDDERGYICSCCGGTITADVGAASCPHCSRDLSWDIEDWDSGFPWEEPSNTDEWPDENDLSNLLSI